VLFHNLYRCPLLTLNPSIMPYEQFPLNTPFKPSPSLITWFRVDFLLVIVLLLVTSYAPVAIFGGLPLVTHVWILSGLIVGIILYFVWVRLYYQSMWYELREDEMSWKRGVWFRKTGIVPYNRVTNLDIRQGPVMRALHISTLSIQTAGYSGQAMPEIRIEAIVHAEELRELIRSMVRTAGREGDGTGTGIPSRMPGTLSTDIEMLEELRKIRSLLEKGR
jgi:membrane protein YdbS with pleckstrin-like domain